jgi:hypothetical protein
MHGDIEKRRRGGNAASEGITRKLERSDDTPEPAYRTDAEENAAYRRAQRAAYKAKMADQPRPEYPGLRVGYVYRIGIHQYRWLIEINDVNFMMTTAQIARGPGGDRFREVFKHLRVSPRIAPPSVWDDVLQDRILMGYEG